jgi:hypothetical protein
MTFREGAFGIGVLGALGCGLTQSGGPALAPTSDLNRLGAMLGGGSLRRPADESNARLAP